MKSRLTNVHWLLVSCSILILSVVFASCSSDDEETTEGSTILNGISENPSPDTGKDNTTDKAVTGGVIIDGYNNLTILGYVNIDVNLAITAKVGVEISVAEDFSNPTIGEATELVNGRSFMIIISPYSGLLKNGIRYYYRTYLKIGLAIYYGQTLSFVMKDQPHMIDLGLSVKWADINVGASTPEDYGNYFAWGETTPKTTYNWNTYALCKGSYNKIIKYCTNSDYGIVDNKTTLELTDDAARANWGGTWRMPTINELNELITKCTWSSTIQKNVTGYLVTGPNGNSIFLPAAGAYFGASLDLAGSFGKYWSSSLVTSDPTSAYDLSGDTSIDNFFTKARCHGRSVRPVTE